MQEQVLLEIPLQPNSDIINIQQNKRLIWLEICLNVCPMWTIKKCCCMDFIMILVIIIVNVGHFVYNFYRNYQHYGNVLFTIWYYAEGFIIVITSMVTLYYYVFVYKKYYDIEYIKKFEELNVVSVNGFRYKRVYCEVTFFFVISLFIEGVLLWANLTDPDSTTIFEDYILYGLMRIFYLFPTILTVCVYSIIVFQYASVLKMIENAVSNDNINGDDLFRDYKKLHEKFSKDTRILKIIIILVIATILCDLWANMSSILNSIQMIQYNIASTIEDTVFLLMIVYQSNKICTIFNTFKADLENILFNECNTSNHYNSTQYTILLLYIKKYPLHIQIYGSPISNINAIKLVCVFIATKALSYSVYNINDD